MPPTINKRTGLTLLCILEENEDDNNKEHMTKEEKSVVKVVTKIWDDDGNLAFVVYRKKGQPLKIIDRQSLHRETVFKSIGKG
eukprot:133259-Ditylum_brightwellii.AAC.1